jgi:hypothetical protein
MHTGEVGIEITPVLAAPSLESKVAAQFRGTPPLGVPRLQGGGAPSVLLRAIFLPCLRRCLCLFP